MLDAAPRVLLIEDSPSQALTFQQYLANEPIKLLHAADGKQAKQMISHSCPDLILLDLILPDTTGQALLRWIHEHHFDTAVVAITAHSSVDIAVNMMREGAQDFLQKPFNAARLKTTVNNTLKHKRLEYLVDNIESTFERDHYHGFIGASLPMQAIYRIVDSAAPSKATVFITGESGTGKEVCAEAIHKQGSRQGKPFIALNCGAIPKDLMESEIFGHVKGAFTGAVSNRTGAASQADGGTLFLDEIGEMNLDLQTKLLRFIQTGSFQRVGGSKTEKVDVRFICATNRDPLAMIEAGTFREDLYYRLHVIPIHLPPLRERNDDIAILAQHFLLQFSKEEGKSFNRISSKVISTFRQYNWPGNIRQLQNIIRNITVLHNAETVQLQHLPSPLNSDQKIPSPSKVESSPTITVPHQTPSIQNESTNIQPLGQVEREVIERAITLCDDNIPKAAALLGVSPSTIYRKKQTWKT